MTPLYHSRNVVSFPARAFTLRKHLDAAESIPEAVETAMEGLDELHCLLAHCRESNIPAPDVPLGFIRRTKKQVMAAHSLKIVQLTASLIADELMRCERHLIDLGYPLPPMYVLDVA